MLHNICWEILSRKTEEEIVGGLSGESQTAHKFCQTKYFVKNYMNFGRNIKMILKRAKMPQGQKNKIEVELQRDWRLTYNAEHTENIDGWSADNVYGGWQLSQEVRDTSVGKAHQIAIITSTSQMRNSATVLGLAQGSTLQQEQHTSQTGPSLLITDPLSQISLLTWNTIITGFKCFWISQ